MDTKDEKYHLRCLEIANKGLGLVAPNPLVGAILVYEDQIIGEGYHASFGGPHAEVNAINAVKDKSKLKNSTLYVNLEPCSHFGKTPPCVDLIIKNKIPRVAIGQQDPYPEVAGKGIEKLKSAGIEVIVGFSENECRFLNRRFLTFHEKKRPYVILKWAETKDGFIDYIRNAGTDQPPARITDETIRPLVHKWRSEEQAILVGTNTALLDDPILNVREWSGKNPIRMVLDRKLRLPENLNIFNKLQPTVVFTQMDSKNNTNLRFHKIDFSDLTDEIFKFCYDIKIQSLMVEGGTQTLNTFIQQGKWDEARVFKSENCFGDGIKAPKINKLPNNQLHTENSDLFIFYND
jgi:diaminohydroxyphosphoribosylaminopyrimidine deaminase / 5-amino-6-(5-phosphoribosylamino)uracil reductase